MRLKTNAPIIAWLIALLVSVFSAQADEKLSGLQTTLSSTTISGSVAADILTPTVNLPFTASQPQQQISGRQAGVAESSQPRSRNDRSVLLPSPINPPETEISAGSLVFTDTGLQDPSLSLQTPIIPVGQPDFTTGVILVGLWGEEAQELNFSTMETVQFASLLPTPDLQIQFNQAGIQPAPEPPTMAIASLALGLIALTCWNWHRRAKA